MATKKKAYIIKVTKTDIKMGVPGSSQTCAISRAAKRTFRGKQISTGPFRMTVRNGEEFVFLLPQRAKDFIRTFDGWRGKENAKPFQFTLRK